VPWTWDRALDLGSENARQHVAMLPCPGLGIRECAAASVGEYALDLRQVGVHPWLQTLDPTNVGPPLSTHQQQGCPRSHSQPVFACTSAHSLSHSQPVCLAHSLSVPVNCTCLCLCNCTRTRSEEGEDRDRATQQWTGVLGRRWVRDVEGKDLRGPRCVSAPVQLVSACPLLVGARLQAALV